MTREEYLYNGRLEAEQIKGWAGEYGKFISELSIASHKRIIAQALAEGKVVPTRVLKEYGMLNEQGG